MSHDLSHDKNALPRLWDYTTRDHVRTAIALAVEEDLGPLRRDITSQTLVPESARTTAVMRSRQPGHLSGLALLPEIVAAYDPAIALRVPMQDGQPIAPGEIAAEFAGPLRSILAMERIALNFTTHLSGIATLTAQYVALTQGTEARICDTRKTLPGLRAFQKYAVACGGGTNHRIGLYDAMLVKDNHIAHLSLQELPGALATAIASARRASPAISFVEVEVDTLEQLALVLALPVDARPDMVLLDNMSPALLKQAVLMRNAQATNVLLEASGGVNLRTVAAIAQTGVDRISIGALTHSAPSLDLGLDIA